MNDEKSKQEPEYTYEDYERDPTACGYTLVERDGKQYYSRTRQYGKVTLTLYRPVLTPEEKKSRDKQIMSVVSRVLSKYDNLSEK